MMKCSKGIEGGKKIILRCIQNRKRKRVQAEKGQRRISEMIKNIMVHTQ